MTKHTKGPWIVLPEEHDKKYIRIRGTLLGGRYKIANVNAVVYDEKISTIISEREAEETRANAKRIVDCVNACEGMNSPSKEIEQMREQIKALNDELVILRNSVSAKFGPQRNNDWKWPASPAIFTSATLNAASRVSGDIIV